MRLKDRVLFFIQTYHGSKKLIGACTYEFWQEINQKINARNKYSDTLYWNDSMGEVEHDIANFNAVNKLKKIIGE